MSDQPATEQESPQDVIAHELSFSLDAPRPMTALAENVLDALDRAGYTVAARAQDGPTAPTGPAPDTGADGAPARPAQGRSELQPIPDEWLMLALSAAAGKPLTNDVHDLIDYSTDEHEAMAHALAAVQGPMMRVAEQAARAQVADEILAEANMLRAEAERLEDGNRLDCLEAIGVSAEARHLERAAEIARGDQ